MNQDDYIREFGGVEPWRGRSEVEGYNHLASIGHDKLKPLVPPQSQVTVWDRLNEDEEE